VTVDEGTTATFSIMADGQAPLAYQWQRNGTDLPGATGAGYAAQAGWLDRDSRYTVRVANVAGSVVSRTATLSVQPAIGNALSLLAGSVPTNVNNEPFGDGTGAGARFSNATSAAVDLQGNVVVTEPYGLRTVTPAGVVKTIAGTTTERGFVDGVAPVVRFNGLTAVAVHTDGTVYVADRYNYAIRRVTAQGVVSTLLGGPERPGNVDGPLASARLQAPIGLALDRAGNLFVLDAEPSSCVDDNVFGSVRTYVSVRVRRIGLDGQVSTVPGTTVATALGGSQLLLGGGIALDGAGTVYMSITKVPAPGPILGVGCGSFRRPSVAAYVQKVTPTGETTVVAGSTESGGAVDGPAAAARFGWPTHMVFDRFGALYIADADNQAVRRLDPSGSVQTVVGTLSATPPASVQLGPLPAQPWIVRALSQAPNGNLVLVTGPWYGQAVLRTERR
jgi:hypothetical protein